MERATTLGAGPVKQAPELDRCLRGIHSKVGDAIVRLEAMLDRFAHSPKDVPDNRSSAVEPVPTWAIDLAEMDPDVAQRVLAQTFVLCRTKVLDVPLGVVNGTSGDLFDPDKVYRFGKEIVAKLDPSKGLSGDALEAAKQKATEEGRAAFYAGKNVAENPYKNDGPIECKIAWVTAYDIAADKAEGSDALKPNGKNGAKGNDETKLAAAYEGGCVAARNGEPRSDNPYDGGSDEHQRWDLGYANTTGVTKPNRRAGSRGERLNHAH